MVMTIPSIQKNFHPLYDTPRQSSQNLKYTAELAAKAVEPTVWTCGKARGQDENALDPITNQRPFFAFVHVYKTAGSTVRDFFRQYATICNKSLAVVAKCKFSWQAGGNLENCRLISSHNAPQNIERVNNTILHDHYDILAGHFRFGMADNIFSNVAVTPNTKGGGVFQSQVRYMVFLRQQMTKFVSHILYQQKQGNQETTNTLDETAEDIKKRVRSLMESGEYMDSAGYPRSPDTYKFLLTPEQHRTMDDNQEQTTLEEVLAHKAQLAIDNLMRYNAIVGMTETFSQSMKIFEHAMGQIVTSAKEEEDLHDLFSRYSGEKESKNGSERKSISTGSVLKQLNEDDEFMTIFREFVKYEQMIVDFAMDMHQKQYEAVQKGHFERYKLENSD